MSNFGHFAENRKYFKIVLNSIHSTQVAAGDVKEIVWKKFIFEILVLVEKKINIATRKKEQDII